MEQARHASDKQSQAKEKKQKPDAYGEISPNKFARSDLILTSALCLSGLIISWLSYARATGTSSDRAEANSPWMLLLFLLVLVVFVVYEWLRHYSIWIASLQGAIVFAFFLIPPAYRKEPDPTYAFCAILAGAIFAGICAGLCAGLTAGICKRVAPSRVPRKTIAKIRTDRSPRKEPGECENRQDRVRKEIFGMNDTRESAKVPSKKTSFAPGDYAPSAAEFPGQTAASIMGWIIGLPVGALLGAVAATVLFDNIQQGSIGALVGMGLTYMILKDIQKSILLRKGRKHYRQLAQAESQNPDACVQAGLWIHKHVKTLQEIEEGDEYYRKALERSPGHRDAIIILAMSLADKGLRSPDHKAVVELLEPWLTEHEDIYGELFIAEALKAQGEHNKAAAHFRRILELHPKTPMKGEIEQYLREHHN